MSKKISRREFLIKSSGGVTCAVIAPDFIRQALAHQQNTNSPLLLGADDAIRTLYAVNQGGDGFGLFLDTADLMPPTLTWREFIECYRSDIDLESVSDEDLEDNFGVRSGDLDDDCDWECYIDAWARSDSPNARAFYYLENLDLAPYQSGRGEPIGGLHFIDGPCPGNDYLGVEARDKMSLSVLQRRLNELGERTEVVLG